VQFDLSVVIRDVNKMLSFAAERKGLKYIDDIEELKSWKVIGDPGRLRQVMTNLLTNSIKFTSEGSVTLRVKVHKETSDLLEVHFTVEDTGIGIEEEVRQKLFTPFSQADSSTARRFGGTGLGLTISKNLVELMHGKINLESRLDQGTKAVFWIPFHKAPYQTADSPVVDIGSIPDRLQSDLSISRAASDTSAPPTPTMPGRPTHSRGPSNGTNAAFGYSEDGDQEQLADVDRNNVNILVVEDNAVNQQIATKTIKKLGFPVQAVWNGKEALEYLQRPSKEQPRPDIILMDVQMPVLDGYRATHSIRNSTLFIKDPVVQNTPIVAMTASAIQGDREKCETAGMDDYLAKPVKKSTLENMLLKWAIEGQKKRAELAKNPLKPTRPSGSRNPSSFTAASESSRMQSPQDRLFSELDRLEFAHRAAFEQSSESTGVLALRHQQAQEKAMLLRDDALIESGEDPRTRLGRGFSEEGHHYEAEEQRSDALTTENMQRFAQNDRMSSLKREESGLEGDNSSIEAKFGESQESQSLGLVSRVSTSNSPSAGFRKPG
jgi:CheY-like chemotaxis protein